jgi:MerR family mercuric resistance operon transcriptional regulator
MVQSLLLKQEVMCMKYRSGDVSKLCNVNRETLRYYERIGLIPEPSRSNSGYRLYPEDTIHRLMFIKRMQELGFTLSEIDKLLGAVEFKRSLPE